MDWGMEEVTDLEVTVEDWRITMEDWGVMVDDFGVAVTDLAVTVNDCGRFTMDVWGMTGCARPEKEVAAGDEVRKVGWVV